jgi:glycosyltransferase involved in cell wall biosynthesis
MSVIRREDVSPLVSVIIPVYSKSVHVLETIRSITQQEYSYVELIVVVDGGECPHVDEILKMETCRVFLIPKSGVSVARNFGLLKASGAYCLFVDHDDLLHELMISTLVENLENDFVAGACACSIQTFIEQSPFPIVDDTVPTVMKIGPAGDPWAAAEAVGKLFIVPSSVLYRKTTLANTGLFNPHYPFTGDFELLINAVQFFELNMISTKLVFYRVHMDNFSKQYEVGMAETNDLCTRLSNYSSRYGKKQRSRHFRRIIGASKRTLAFQALDVARLHWKTRNLHEMMYHLCKSIGLDPYPFVKAVTFQLSVGKSKKR